MNVEAFSDIRAIISNVGGIPYTQQAMEALETLCKAPGAIRAMLGCGMLATNGTKVYP